MSDTLLRVIYTAEPQSATKHCAKFSDSILEAMGDWLDGLEPVLDPMAGVGKLAEVVPCAFLNELEPEWAAECERYPGTTVTVGDARKLPYSDGFFAAIATSPTYGNRMADHHVAVEKCRRCEGTGQVPAPVEEWYFSWDDCPKCRGNGRREYRRNTYRHTLGRALTPGNTGQLQWGPEYRDLHRAIYTDCLRVLQPGGYFVLNVSNHIRKGAEVDVTAWHFQTMTALGLDCMNHRKVKTPRNRHGQNHEARVDFESLFLFQKGTQ